MILRILGITLPIFAIVFAGFVYARYKKPNMSGANHTIIDLALPCFIFISLSAKPLDFTSAGYLVLAAVLIVVFSGLLALPLAKYSGTGAKALLPSIMFTNVGPIGIPLTVLAFGPDGLAPSVLLMVLSNILIFSLGSAVMTGKMDAKSIYASPLVWSMGLGLWFGHFQMTLPDWLDTSVTMVSTILIPLMLISLGTRLAEGKIEHVKAGVVATALSIVLRLLVAYLVIWVLPLEPIQKGALIIFAGLPPAVFNYILADRHNQEPQKVASIVMVGHLLSVIYLPLVIWLAIYTGTP